MNFIKKRLIINIFLILTILILLLTNNKQKTSFRYFIWNIQDLSIGRLVSISFVSGLLMSFLLNKTLNMNSTTKSIIEEEDKNTDKNDYSVNKEYNNEPFDITPERDLRDPQPTISVNYRVIKNNGENELKERNQTLKNLQYDDDWNDNDYEW